MMNLFWMAVKYWKAGAVGILVLAMMFQIHLAQSRGEKLDRMRAEEILYQGKIKSLEKAIQNDRERNNFRAKQNRRYKLAQGNAIDFDADSRAMYELLRERQANNGNG